MKQPLLLVLAPALALEDLTQLPHCGAAFARGRAIARVHRLPDIHPIPRVLHDIVDQLRDLEMDVECRALTLRPCWRGDDALLLELERRTSGPADVTIVELTDAGRAAAVDGPESAAFRAARLRFDQHVLRLERMLDCKGPVETWILARGRLRGIERTVDPGRWLALFKSRHGVRDGSIRLRQTPQVALFDSAHGQLAMALEDGLARSFHRFGRILSAGERSGTGLPTRACCTVVVPAPGVAFGSTPVRGVFPLLPLAPHDCGAALLPSVGTSHFELDETDVLARFLARAAERAETIRVQKVAARSEAEPIRSAPALADIEPMLQHDRLHVIENGPDVLPFR